MASSIETGLTLPLIGHLYDHTGAAFKQSFRLLNTPDISLAINGQGASAITLELEAPLSGGNSAPAKGDILTLTEDGGDGAVIYKGIVEDFPDERGATTAHQILVNPVGVQLGDTPFTTNYTSATDIGQIARDIVTACPNLTFDATSIPLVGSNAIFDFSGTQGYTCLTALEELRKMAGSGYFYWPDATGKVKFKAANIAGAADHSITVAPLTEARRYTAPVANRKNIVNGYGANLLSATYDNSAGSPLGKRVLTPPLTYSQLTDLTTLQTIVNTVGSIVDREHVTVELDLINYPTRVQPGDVLRYFEETVNERPESGSWIAGGAYSPNYVVLSVKQNGPRQSVVASDIPWTVEDLQYQLDSMLARMAAGAVTDISPGDPASITPVMIGSTVPATPAAPSLGTAVERTAQIDNANVSVTWLANPGGDHVGNYKVRWRQGSGPYKYEDAGGGSLTLTIHNLTPGLSYGFSVAAVNTLGNLSAYSTEATIVAASDSTAPGVPTGLSAIKTPRGALVSWNGNTEADLQGYDLQVSVGGGAYFTILSNALVTSFAYTAAAGTALSTSLQFKVRALDWSGNASAFSASSTAVNTDGIVFDELLAGNVKVFGTLTTGGLQTAASGARIVLDSTSLRIYDGSATNYGAPSGVGVTAELKNDGTAFFKGTISASSVYGSTVATGASVGTTGNAGFKLSGQFLDFYTIGTTPEGNRYFYAPDNVTAFTLAGQLAAASSTFTPPADADLATINNANVDESALTLLSFRATGTVSPVAVGALATSATSSIAPAYGAATGAGHLLIAWVMTNGSDCSASGWSSNFNSFFGGLGTHGATFIFWRWNSSAGEAAPTFNSTGATIMSAQLAEFSGIVTAFDPRDLIGHANDTSGTQLVAFCQNNEGAPSADHLSGQLFVTGSFWHLTSASTVVMTDTYTVATATVAGQTGGTSQAVHATFAYGVTNWPPVTVAKVLQLTNFIGLEAITTDSNNPARGFITTQYSTDHGPSVLGLRKARGTATSPTSVVTGDSIGVLTAHAYDGSNWNEVGRAGWLADSAAAGTIPTEFFVAVRNSTGREALPLVIGSDSTVQLGQDLVNGGVFLGSDSSWNIGGPLNAPFDSNLSFAPSSWGSFPVKIDEIVLGSDVGFQDFPASGSYDLSKFRKIVVDVWARGSASAVNVLLGLRFNSDASSVYDYTVAGIASAAVPTVSAATLAAQIAVGWIAGNTAPANEFSPITISIFRPDDTAHNKVVHAQGMVNDAFTAGNNFATISGGIWHNATSAAITTFRLFPFTGNLKAGSTFTVWGYP